MLAVSYETDIHEGPHFANITPWKKKIICVEFLVVKSFHVQTGLLHQEEYLLDRRKEGDSLVDYSSHPAVLGNSFRGRRELLSWTKVCVP